MAENCFDHARRDRDRAGSNGLGLRAPRRCRLRSLPYRCFPARLHGPRNRGASQSSGDGSGSPASQRDDRSGLPRVFRSGSSLSRSGDAEAEPEHCGETETARGPAGGVQEVATRHHGRPGREAVATGIRFFPFRGDQPAWCPEQCLVGPGRSMCHRRRTGAGLGAEIPDTPAGLCGAAASPEETYRARRTVARIRNDEITIEGDTG